MIIIIGIAIFLILLQQIELRRFRVTTYQMEHEAVEEELKLCFLSDLHGHTYRGRLLKRLKEEQPDCILLGGDVVSHCCPNQLEEMIPFMQKLSEIAPVYYGFGNHESALDQMNEISECITEEDKELLLQWNHYIEKVIACGIHIIRNEYVDITKRVRLWALELPVSNYQKRTLAPLRLETLESLLDQTQQQFWEDHEQGKCQIMMVHQPAYGELYKELAPDVILSGHTHGGLIRFPFIGSLISPELTLFPRFDGGSYCLTNQKGMQSRLIVSKGLGTHTYHIRILDRAEIVSLRIMPCNAAQNLVK